jgi:hypothetical protein
LLAQGVQQRRTLMPSRSYLSQVSMSLSFGLGPATSIDQITVVWPGGRIERWHDISVNQQLQLTEGSGSPIP